MQSFEWVDAASVEQAVELLSAAAPGEMVLAKAGGLDLLDLMKEGVIAPSRLVNLKRIAGLDQCQARPSGDLEIGALTTLATIATAPVIRERYRALADAAGHAATPQVRNAATIGGNLLQKPRCWYFRNEYFNREDFSNPDPARSGENQYHSIFDNEATAMVHASTPATALVAYHATVELASPGGRKRTVRAGDFFLPPTLKGDRCAAIEPGEVLTAVILPAISEGTKAAYHKQTERESYDWPICDVAVVLQMQEDVISSALIVMGWVAPIPRRAIESERILAGNKVSEKVAAQAAQAAVKGATPLSKNAYKVPILEAVVRRTILAAAA